MAPANMAEDRSKTCLHASGVRVATVTRNVSGSVIE